jgi:ACDE family multidrug resistance protein
MNHQDADEGGIASSAILTPGDAWLVLLVSPISGVFVAGGAGLLMAWVLANKLHPRLGQARISNEGPKKMYPSDRKSRATRGDIAQV